MPVATRARRRLVRKPLPLPTGSPVDGPVVIGRNVRRLRLGRDWSQEELAHRAGLHWTMVGQVERGERNLSIRNVCKLAWALGVKPAELLV
jgi:DNA-binding XRE family transcriptional regulator